MVARPLGVTILALVYVVLGSHALMFGAYLLTLSAAQAPSLPFADLLARDPGIVRLYGAVLVGFAGVHFATGTALWRGLPWARWLTLGAAPIPMLSPPSPLGGVLFAASVNLYIFGSRTADGYLRSRGLQPIPES